MKVFLAITFPGLWRGLPGGVPWGFTASFRCCPVGLPAGKFRKRGQESGPETGELTDRESKRRSAGAYLCGLRPRKGVTPKKTIRTMMISPSIRRTGLRMFIRLTDMIIDALLEYRSRAAMKSNAAGGGTPSGPAAKAYDVSPKISDVSSKASDISPKAGGDAPKALAAAARREAVADS